MPILCAGTASIDITPPVGADLAGGAFGPARGGLHPLSAAALFLTDGFTGLVLIAADVIGFDTDYADAIRGAAARRVGLPASHVMLTATHTHHGPATAADRHRGALDPAYRKRLQARLVELAADATASPRPVSLSAGRGTCAGVAENRVAPDGPVDAQLGVLRVDDLDGRPLAALINAAVPPVRLHGHGDLSPGFPVFLRAGVRAALNPEMEVLYLMGAAGDLTPTGDPAHALANSRRVGQALAAAAVEALASARSGPAVLAAATVACRLPLAPLPPADSLRELIRAGESRLSTLDPQSADWRYCEAKARLAWAREALAVVASGQAQPEEQLIRLHGFRVGPALIVGIPGEPFSECGQAIKAAAPAVTLIAALADGSEGSFPTRRACETGHAAAPRDCGRYRPEVGETVAAAGVELVRVLMG